EEAGWNAVVLRRPALFRHGRPSTYRWDVSRGRRGEDAARPRDIYYYSGSWWARKPVELAFWGNCGKWQVVQTQNAEFGTRNEDRRDFIPHSEFGVPRLEGYDVSIRPLARPD